MLSRVLTLSVLVGNKFTRSALAAVALLTVATYSVGQLPAVMQAQKECVLSVKGKLFDYYIEEAKNALWRKNKSLSSHYKELAEQLIDDEFASKSQLSKRYSAYGAEFLAYLYLTHGEPKKCLIVSRKVFNSLDARAKPWQLDENSEALCALGDFEGALKALQLSRQLANLPPEYTDRSYDYS